MEECTQARILSLQAPFLQMCNQEMKIWSICYVHKGTLHVTHVRTEQVEVHVAGFSPRGQFNAMFSAGLLPLMQERLTIIDVPRMLHTLKVNRDCEF
jgi:hypothetical protein